MIQDQSGFSLVEVMVAVVILALTSVFSYPSMQILQKKETMNSEVRGLVHSLMNAKFEAIKRNSFVVVQFTDTGYSIFVDDGAKGGRAKDWLRQSGEEEIVHHLSADDLTITTNFSLDRMRFKGRGGVKAGTIVFLRKGRKNTKIVLNIAGRVRVEKI